MPKSTTYHISMAITTVTKKTEKSKPTAKTETVISKSYATQKDAYDAVASEVKAKVPQGLDMTGTWYAAGTVEMQFGDEEGKMSVEVVVEIVERVEGEETEEEEGMRDEEGEEKGGEMRDEEGEGMGDEDQGEEVRDEI